ncbi:conjugal transfer protein MobC [Chitinophaga sp. Ak27]|uniref:conjugal transfer protein MobC n=1 Tax=Chitinophaga sp. Ak27 TaxID=2726116 RepID=UPI00145E6BF4|nr:conjugal transfer protein MobC [Chitinophaga sp. Ak27]NLU91392.1 type IV secretory system conjugative DNA transfer family protein [Chitinophaga sp. Ak27]
MSSGENEQGLRAITDFMRKGSIVMLILHFYVFCYTAFELWGLTAAPVKNVLLNLGKTGLFSDLHITKGFALLLLLLSVFGSKGKKDETIRPGQVVAYIFFGVAIFFASYFLLTIGFTVDITAVAYISVTTIGFVLFLTGAARLSRLIKVKLGGDIFNEENETFPQEERLLENPFSVNLPGKYQYRGQVRKMWLNIINGARMVLIIGGPGAGKTYFLIRNIIKQKIERKNFPGMLLYDFKYDDLAVIAYNSWLKAGHLYRKKPRFLIVNFDNPIDRCNPLEPSTMRDITDASESARTILLGLNMQWLQKTGDFFVESPINFLTAIIWFLKKFKGGKFCTLPHAIELMQADYDDLFPILSTEPEIEVLINPFISAYMNRAMEQLEGQIASAKIALARLASPLLYYVLGASDFTLDINNPDDPKIVVLANNPEKTQIYGAVISLYLNRVFRILPKKGMEKCCIIADEFSSLYANGIENFLAISRGYRIFCYLAIQNIAQLRKSYGREQADVIFNLAGNIICGQAIGDTAKAVSEAIGKIVQTRESISINRQDTSISRNTQLDFAVPASKISTLSAGEFVGILADNPDQVIKYKAFHTAIQNDHEAIKSEESKYKQLPCSKVTDMDLQNNYILIKNDIIDLVGTEIERIKNDPDLAHLIFIKA